MTEPLIKQTLSNPKYENWVKAGLSLLITKEGIQDFVAGEIDNFQKKLLCDISTKVPGSTVCSRCTTRNVLKCPTHAICKTRGNCDYHDRNNPAATTKSCPSNFCNEVQRRIIQSHRYQAPSWKNTNALQWSSDSWELAKCYLPQDGYRSVTSAVDTDLVGLVSVVINHKDFQNVVEGDLTQTNNLFCQARTIRNNILHSPTLQMTTADLNFAIDTLIILLSDTKHLASDQKAQYAIAKLKEVKNGFLSVTVDDEITVKLLRDNFLTQYIREKKNLQRDLIKLYQKRCLNTPIYPLTPRKAVKIDCVYVPPCLKRVDPHIYKDSGSKDKTVRGYNDLFPNDSNPCRNIYITGDAGMGKSTFCQHMVLTWCLAHKKNDQMSSETMSGSGSLHSQDEESMCQFDFLFYISLRDATQYSDIEEMIKRHLLNKKYHLILSKILADESENCLILLDGLDEWSPPTQNDQTSPLVNKGLPGREVMADYTIITTTRPWKLQVLELTLSEIDLQIELVGLDADSSDKLIVNMVTLLNQTNEKDMSAKEFKNMVKEKKTEFKRMVKETKLEEFTTIPVILKQMVCLWHVGKNIGNSQCEIYSGMINRMFELAEKPSERLAGKRDADRMKKESTTSSVKLPKCFEGKSQCQEFRQLLNSLAKLAFQTLFDQNRESSLVFDTSVTEKWGMSKTEYDISLQVGILSQAEVFEDIISQHKKLFFFHKTFQEFLAALFISMSTHDSQDAHFKTMTSICTSLDKVFEMSKVFLFISGMNPEIACRFSEHISKVASEDQTVQTYRRTTDDKFSQSYHRTCHIQDIVTDCVEESFQNGYHGSQFKLTDITLKTYGNPPHVLHLMETNLGSIKSLYIDDYLPGNLQVMSIKSLHKLFINSSYIGSDMIYKLVVNSKESLVTLCIWFTQFASMSLELYSEMMLSLHHLVALKLYITTLTHAQVESLMSILSKKTQLKQVHLYNLKCTDCGDDCGYQMNLSQYTQLQDLELGDLRVNNVLVNTTNMERCKIEELYQLGAEASIMRSLCDAPKLQRLYCRYCKDPEYIDALVTTVPTLLSLKEISLLFINFGGREFKLSPEMKNLNSVDIHRSSMSSKSFCSFVDSIPVTPRQVNVEIYEITITPPEEANRALDYVRNSLRFVVTEERIKGHIYLKFHTVKTRHTDRR